MKCLLKKTGGVCRSPVACGGFGYCRERNFDGTPMTEAKLARNREAQRADDAGREAK